MTGPAYPAARAVATTVAAHFARQIEAARREGRRELAPGPDARTIEAITDTAFWASLQREEGQAPKISLAFLPPESAGGPLLFERRLPLSSRTLVKLAPAVERPGIHLGLWREGDELFVWGATRTIPNLCFVLEVVEPGLLVIKHRRGEEAGKFANVAVLQGDQVKVVDQRGGTPPGCPNLATSLLCLDAAAPAADSVNVLVQLAVSMRAHGRGGSLLVVPDDSEAWRESIIHPVSYSVQPSFSELAELMQRDLSDRSEAAWHGALRRTVDGIAGLTAVDGAVVLTDRYRVLAFGAKIARREGGAPIQRLITTEPVVGGITAVMHPAQIGGTRHLSAAQFVHDQHDALALVASQDGRFTAFAWSPCEETVRAHRMEILLL